MKHLKTKEEIERMRESAQLVSKTLGMLAEHIKPGISTLELDKLAETFIRDHGAKPGFLGLYGCPSTLLISVNEAVVHGLPSKKPLQDGDIASVDCGVLWHDFYGDHAYTFEVGEVKPDIKTLLETTKESLYLGVSLCQSDKTAGDVGHAIQSFCESKGYGVVRELTGHALGKSLHEEPPMPNYGKIGKGPKLENGMVLAIEPMVNMGTHNVVQLSDGWTIISKDKKPSAHFEHNVAIWEGEPVLLSTFDYIYAVFQKQHVAYTDYYDKYFPEKPKATI